ncbi:Tim44/TimA family putative adaptor protein [Ahrensia marina]|uniref:Tim44/TimA family putative adaptor protein n=1 Tax=Ahrensia marina TaxID=1514904 RepID=UPI0035CFE189
MDIYTLFFLAIAVVIFFRLRSVLGKRTGEERPPFDPYTAREEAETGGDKVVTLPTARARQAADPDDQIGGVVKPGSAVEGALKTLLSADPSFHAREFVDGARLAYEMIVTAFASGDKATLQPLLDEEVYQGFVQAIDERNAAGETVDFTFIGLDKSDIMEAELANQIAQITMRFKSQLISVTKDSDGRVIDGDPTEVTEMTDIWTFARDVSSGDPNWKLVATEAT